MRARHRRPILSALLFLATCSGAEAATPPALLHYQGVLRSGTDVPLDGRYDMVFRFLDPGGVEILVDKHTTTQGGFVSVTLGVFTVTLGSGAVFDGTGAGTYTSLADVFRDYSDVNLEIQVNGETLSPWTKVMSSPYALNATNLGGKPATSFLDTTSTAQTKAGALTIAAVFPNFTGLTVTAPSTGATFSTTFSNVSLAASQAGIEASGWDWGGHFVEMNGPGEAYLAKDDYGVQGFGTPGGLFASTDDYGVAYLGASGAGVIGEGSVFGAEFSSGGSAWTFVADVDRGIDAQGNEMGGFFFNPADFSSSRVAYFNRGIWGRGYFAGGTFSHPDALTFWADVSTPTKKIQGTGTVSFVQNHPYEKDKVVVYAAPEGDEVAVYTRGTGRLEGGQARVVLGSTFALVANPDLGLTAHVTPAEEPVPLSAEVLSTSEILVRGPAGSSAKFHYLVYGLRIGFERHPVIQKKDRDAFLPDGASFDAIGAADAKLGATTARARFEGMRPAAGESGPVDLARAESLAARIDEGKAEATATAMAAVLAERAERESSRPRQRTAVEVGSRSVPVAAHAALAAVRSSPDPMPSAAAGRIAPAVLPQLTLLPVSGSASAGDVLVLDATAPGWLRASDRATDAGVAGCVLEDPEGFQVPAGVRAIATTGAALCRVDASHGAIALGDLLTTSSTPGHAMRAGEPAAGAILGKAMEPLASGTGTIRVLVTLQ
jgi:hypothetical protein